MLVLVNIICAVPRVVCVSRKNLTQGWPEGLGSTPQALGQLEPSEHTHAHDPALWRAEEARQQGPGTCPAGHLPWE